MAKSNGPVAPGTTFKRRAPSLILPERRIMRQSMGQSSQMQQGHFGFGLISGADSFNIADYFNTTVYTGSGVAQSITTGMDLANNAGMIMVGENRTAYPLIWDTLRGATNYISVGQANSEATSANTLTAFNNNGFSAGTVVPNNSGIANAAWTLRKHPKLFNVITYTGTGAARAIAHGLSGAPGMVIVKDLGNANQGLVWHKGLTTGNYISWNAAAQSASSASALFGNGTVTIDPDSANVYLGSGTGANVSSVNYVMYVFADDPTGYIASGSYVGNGSTTGPVVTLGWEPQWLLIKQINGTQNWNVYDSVRGFSTRKPWAATAYTSTGVSIAVGATTFQPTTADSAVNLNGSTYLYTAIRKP